MTSLDQLPAPQRALVERWLPGARVVADHSWGQVGTTVLEVVHDGRRYVVKAADEHDHHLARELRAHRDWLAVWTRTGHAPRLRHADERARVLVTDYLPGRLVLGSPAQHDPATYAAAGRLLARFHAQAAAPDPDHEERENRRALAWLDQPHRIAPDVVARLRAEVASWPTPPAVLVPTHGDWQPRNWLVGEDGTVRVIDLGRFDLRPAMSDLARLAAQDFRRDPALEAAFLEGYGADPREPAAWHRTRVREAVATAVWARRVGDRAFEAQGHRMLADALGPAAPPG